MAPRLATSYVLAIVAACSPSDRNTRRATDQVPTNVHEAGASQAKDTGQPDAERFCDAFDRTAVANAMGWRELKRIGSDTCSSDRDVCSCMFLATDHPDGAGFGVMFMRTNEFMASHLDAPYVSREPIASHDAVVAKHANRKFVSIQVRVGGIVIETNANDAGPPDSVEARLADATAKLLATLAFDPAAALRE